MSMPELRVAILDRYKIAKHEANQTGSTSTNMVGRERAREPAASGNRRRASG
jgi:hypothetical protein